MDRQEITASTNLRHALKRLLRHPWALAAVSGVALLGMVKTPPLNRVLSATVEDHLAGNTWRVVHP